jgi:hypothetical protein
MTGPERAAFAASAGPVPAVRAGRANAAAKPATMTTVLMLTWLS